MARFDICTIRNGALVIDCQADILAGLKTRFVVPLIEEKDGLEPAQRLTPVFEISGRRYVMMTHLAAGIPVGEMQVIVGSLADQEAEIRGALDLLLVGP
ncbi:CcdB family protein [Allosphingosinicella deserti]|uniref:Toxin CcdB n=1 Tax=Allosphingosinicella deserti TaxID=2116704 RepID=A0A2P7QN87_9SPHN|nr:CcdB family protein [Sphingomonas deserti]PSJ39429.1 plasmid maintenance protein CcdB [Sphingomonas deserti]